MIKYLWNDWREMIALLIVCMLATYKASFEPSPQVLALFEEREVRFSGGRYNNRLFRYRLHTPNGIDRTKHYPILLWLHGGRERGDDNRAQLRWMDVVFEKLRPVEVQCYILAVQVPADVEYWADGSVDDSMLTVAKSILDDAINNLPVDKNRIYLAGVSSGGTGCWEMAMRYPDTFAAVAPMASFGGSPSLVGKVKHVPIWTFHSQADHPEWVQLTVESLRSIGGSVYLTLITSDPDDLSDWQHKHDCWRTAIQEYDVMNWLMKQARGSPVVPPPGHERWNWRHLSVVGLGLVVLCGSSWSLASRLRLRYI